MTARPSHAMQQVEIDETLAAMPTKRWAWLFTPDPRWLNTVNTTSLRTVNAIRMFIGVTVLWAVIEVAVVWRALTMCNGWTHLPLSPGESVAKVLLLCEESLSVARLFDFAKALFDGYGLLLAGMAGIAVAGALVNRATDTEHRERVERAKKAPVIVAPLPTSEHPVPQQNVNVNVGEDAKGADVTQATVGSDDPPPEEHEWATGDKRAGIL